MKLKITSTYALLTTAVAVLVSSCGSNVTVAKRYHSGGFNFSFGGGTDGEKAVAKTSVKKPVIKKIGKMPAADVAEETAVVAIANPKTVSNYAEAALKQTNKLLFHQLLLRLHLFWQQKQEKNLVMKL